MHADRLGDLWAHYHALEMATHAWVHPLRMKDARLLLDLFTLLAIPGAVQEDSGLPECEIHLRNSRGGRDTILRILEWRQEPTSACLEDLVAKASGGEFSCLGCRGGSVAHTCGHMPETPAKALASAFVAFIEANRAASERSAS